MKRTLLPLLMALLLSILPAAAEAPLTLSDPLTGTFLYPENSTDADALYIYRYHLPRAAGDSDIALHINTTYSYMVEDALAFEVPMLASEMQPGDPQKIVDISYAVTCQNAEYLSILLTKQVSTGGESTNVVTGHVIALTGIGAGKVTSLPVFLGLLEPDETDEWLLNRQTNKADKVVRELLWEQLQSRNTLTGRNDLPEIYEDLTFEEIEAGFYPEEDYFLDETGTPCFYFQPGMVAPEEYGPIIIPLSLDVLMDEL